MDVAAVAGGWAPAVVTGVVPPEEPDAAETIIQVSLGGRVRIQVVGPEGQPVSGVQVRLSPAVGFPGSTMALNLQPAPPTGADGTTLVSLLPAGAYDMSIAGRKDVPTTRVTIHEGQESTAVITLP